MIVLKDIIADFCIFFYNIHSYLKLSQHSWVAAGRQAATEARFFYFKYLLQYFYTLSSLFMNTYHAHFMLRKIWKCWKFSYFDMTQVCIFKKNTDRPKFLDKKVFAWVWDVWIRYGIQVKKSVKSKDLKKKNKLEFHQNCRADSFWGLV